MKFKLLEREEQRIFPITEDEFNTLVKKNCKKYERLTQQNIHFYRGMDSGYPDYLSVIPRKNRVPKDTPLQIHNTFDNMLYDKFGWRPRSTGVFVVADKYTASCFGTLYEVYPLDGFKYVWSPEIEDFFEHLTNENIKPSEMDNFLQDAADTYISTDIDAAIFGTEIVLKCDKYFAHKIEGQDAV